MNRAVIFLCLLGLAACAQFPELDDRLTPGLEDAAYPALVPLEGLAAARPSDAATPAAVTRGLEARIAALQSRADRLRGSVLSPAERNRLRQRPAG